MPPTTPRLSADALDQLSPAQRRELLAKLLQEKSAAAGRYPMSAGQQGLWHAFRRDPRATPFNVYLPTRMRCRLDAQALRQAINLLAARHPCLRTTFTDAGGRLEQQVHAELLPAFEIVDAPGATAEQVREWLVRDALQPFDLERGPLLRVKLYQLADDDWIILALTHHIVVDFWSLVLILNEIRGVLPDLLAARTPHLPPAAANYRKFVQEQAEHLAGPRGELDRQYWRDVVQQASPVLELPLDKPRPAVFTGRAETVQLNFPDGIAPRITALAQRLKSTTFAVVHTALQVLLSRTSGQESFFIGSPFSGRTQREYEQTVGFFVNMLPLPARPNPDRTFAELIGTTTQNLLAALEHEAYPVANIVHDASLGRDPSRSPLFQVSCTYERAQLAQEAGRAGFLFPCETQVWEFAGLQQESFYIPHPTCHYDLEFVFEQVGNQLHGIVLYCRDLFDAATVRQISSNFGGLLEALTAHPEQPLRDVGWSTSGARVPGIPTSNTTTNRSNTVYEQIWTAAARDPAAVALQAPDQRWTYAELLAGAQLLCDQLRSHGVQADDLVPIIAEPGPGVFVAMLGVQLSGGAPVPIDARQPAIQLARLVEDTQAKVVIGELTAEARQTSAPTGLIDLPSSPPPHAPPPTLTCRAQPQNLAYVIYTSGSTGQPKGVQVEHAAVCNTLNWRKRQLPLQPDDRVLMLLSHQFDAGLGIGWTSLTQGAGLVWPAAPAVIDASQLIDDMLREQITVLPAVPSLLRVITTHPRFAECQRLRYVWAGGEALPPDLPPHIRRCCAARVWNFYGPTEAAIEAAACDVTEHTGDGPIPLGQPIDSTQVLIVDAQHRPVPAAVPGEIAIAGAGLARGYLNQPDLTRQKFVELPGEDSQTHRVYLTGDRGRCRPDGTLEFLGRQDHQVKLRGYRIELGEIEAVLEAHPRVLRAAVQVLDPQTAQARLAAYVQLAPSDNSPDDPPQPPDSLPSFLRERLPSYKLPSSLTLLPEMPLTSSGKVDRGSLPYVPPQASAAGDIVGPRTPLEAYLAQAWCETLGLDEISVHQNFFDAGGSSLQAAMLTGKLSEALSVPVPTALIFDLADIAQIAERLAQLHPATIRQQFGEASLLRHDSGDASDSADSATSLHPLLAALKPNGSRLPIFMVHPPGGIVSCYRELARYLTEDQPLFAIRSRGLHGQERLPASLREMAADYRTAIQSVQPAGPYCLGGWSLGGLIAYEIAQQLLAGGDRDSQIMLLDTTIPEGASDRVPLQEQVSVGREYGIDLRLEQLGELAPEEQLPFLWEHAKRLGVLQDDSPAEVVSATLHDLQGLFHHHVQLTRSYRLQPLAARVTLFRPTQVPCEVPVSPDRGWNYLVDSVDVRWVPGHHHSMVQAPHVKQLARLISAACVQDRPPADE